MNKDIGNLRIQVKSVPNCAEHTDRQAQDKSIHWAKTALRCTEEEMKAH